MRLSALLSADQHWMAEDYRAPKKSAVDFNSDSGRNRHDCVSLALSLLTHTAAACLPADVGNVCVRCTRI